MPARSLGDSSAPVRVCVSPECRAGHAGCEQAGGRAGERGLVHPCADMGRGRTPAWVQAPGSAGSAATPPAAVGPCTFPSGAPRATRRRRGPCRRAPLAPVATGRRAGTRSSRILASRRASSASTSSSQLPAPIDQKISLWSDDTARFRRHEIQDSGIGIRNPEWRMHFQSTVVPEALPGTR